MNTERVFILPGVCDDKFIQIIIAGGSLKSNSINKRIIQILCDEFLLSQLT